MNPPFFSFPFSTFIVDSETSLVNSAIRSSGKFSSLRSFLSAMSLREPSILLTTPRLATFFALS